DFWLRTVSLRDSALPRLGIEPLGGLTAIPEVHASSRSILSVQIVLPDETGDAAIVWRRFLEHGLCIVAGSPFREPEANDGSDHCNLQRKKVLSVVVDIKTISHEIASGNRPASVRWSN